MSVLSSWIAHRLWLLNGAASSRAYRAALGAPRRAQERLLLDLLRRNAESEFGRRHRFVAIHSLDEYRRAVPVSTYDDLAPDIERMKRGESNVLVTEPVLMFEKTSGSSGGAKYIPYTRSLRAEFMRAVEPWMDDLHRARPTLLRGPAYWSVSPPAAIGERTECGLPVGFSDDTEYFSPLARRVLSTILATPPELAQVPDMESVRYVTLRFLLAAPRLAFVSVWNPSFLTLLLRALARHADRLLDDLERGTLSAPHSLPTDLQRTLEARLRPAPNRVRQLRAALTSATSIDFHRVWPHLAIVSAWGDAAAERSLAELRTTLPRVEVQPKGLLATEGVTSIPVVGQDAAALAVTSHLLEFIDDRGGVFAVDEIESGREYRVLLSTGGGLYRYDTGDRVRVVGRMQATPLVRFVGRGNLVSDLRGEKLDEPFVREAIDVALHEHAIPARFAMLAPEWGDPPRYLLFLEPAPGVVLSEAKRSEIAARLDAALARNPHYELCQRLSQLGAVEVRGVQDGEARYLARCVADGQRAGDVKPTPLHRADRWSEWF
ncbi:MAG: GH3 auxin-responsive promoter family protein [Candidatus Eisenbacteria bacterium]